MSGSRSKRVCIVGAGPAGLAAARWLSQMGHRVCVFEQSSRVGGTWRYNPDENSLPSSLQTSMYAGLITNLTKEVMQYSDLPFPFTTPTYPSHEQVAEYLDSYASRFELFAHIKFRRHVSAAKWNINRCVWKVSTVDVPPDEQLRDFNDVDWKKFVTQAQPSETEEFDSLCICNGVRFLHQLSTLWRLTSLHPAFLGSILS
jgi:cation diffusion facilitator CzcD-associated flavoprotein CzcO